MKPKLIQLLHWLRWPNLVIVVITLAFIRYGLVAPALYKEGLSLSLDSISFILLTLLTLIITFSGYVINDLYDQETDANNKPERRAIGVWMTETKAKSIYLVLVCLGAMLTLYLGWKEEKIQWTWIYPLAVGMLWWYSAKLKSSVLWGNLLVSVFCSGVALLIPFSEKEMLLQLQDGKGLLLTLYFYALFAGTSNLLREIIKDAEDYEGDKLSGLGTLAVIYGTHASRKAALLVTMLLVGILLLFLYSMDLNAKAQIGFSFFNFPFLAILLFHLNKPASKISWTKLSGITKLLMLCGLLSLLFLL